MEEMKEGKGEGLEGRRERNAQCVYGDVLLLSQGYEA